MKPGHHSPLLPWSRIFHPLFHVRQSRCDQKLRFFFISSYIWIIYAFIPLDSDDPAWLHLLMYVFWSARYF